ncbi:MAG: 50S ribosomal protein L9 [Dehalococcoidia bacterium]|nr:50S ribosomal protein L9 [Dehalococcoidia bacterium]
MRVVFLEDVEGVAKGGDVKEVKNGFARNYLIPKSLAVPATHDALQRIEKLAQQAERDRLKKLNDMRALGEELKDARVDVEMRAGSGGRLYGSVTNAIVASRLTELTGKQIDRKSVTVPDSVRELGSYKASVRLHAEVQAEVDILVHPLGTTPDEYLAEMEAAAAAQADGPVETATEFGATEAAAQPEDAQVSVAEAQPEVLGEADEQQAES